MKPRTKPAEPNVEPMFDPILDELYRARDAYARAFNFDTDAICDALKRRTAHAPASAKSSQASLKKSTRHRAGTQGATESKGRSGRNVAVKLAA